MDRRSSGASDSEESFYSAKDGIPPSGIGMEEFMASGLECHGSPKMEMDGASGMALYGGRQRSSSTMSSISDGSIGVPVMNEAFLNPPRRSSSGDYASANGGDVPSPALRRAAWRPDEEVGECMCGARFSFWQRRHHCRCCGGIYCHECSKNRHVMADPLAPPGAAPADPTKPHRVCNSCHHDLRQEDVRGNSTANTDSPPRFCELPFGVDMAREVRKSARTLENFLASGDGNAMDNTERVMKSALFQGAKGLVILTVGKAGLMYGVEGGTGLCVTRLPNGEWSAPSAVGTFGLSWGFQAGCEVVEMVIPLRSDAAVEMLKSGGKLHLEVNAGIAIGPVGRNIGARAWLGGEPTPDLHLAARYGPSKGLFAGVGVGAGVSIARNSANERFYGAQVSPRDLLDGVTPRPHAAGPLYSSLARWEEVMGKGTTTGVGDG